MEWYWRYKENAAWSVLKEHCDLDKLTDAADQDAIDKVYDDCKPLFAV